MSSVSAVMPVGGLADPNVWRKHRRTFGEIVKALAESLKMSCVIDDEGDVAYLDSEDMGDMRIYETGQFCVYEGYLSPDQLAAISAACTEISTLGKEEQ